MYKEFLSYRWEIANEHFLPPSEFDLSTCSKPKRTFTQPPCMVPVHSSLNHTSVQIHFSAAMRKPPGSLTGQLSNNLTGVAKPLCTQQTVALMGTYVHTTGNTVESGNRSHINVWINPVTPYCACSNTIAWPERCSRTWPSKSSCEMRRGKRTSQIGHTLSSSSSGSVPGLASALGLPAESCWVK